MDKSGEKIFLIQIDSSMLIKERTVIVPTIRKSLFLNVFVDDNCF